MGMDVICMARIGLEGHDNRGVNEESGLSNLLMSMGSSAHKLFVQRSTPSCRTRIGAKVG